MKIKTQDLIGPALDWAVAKCEGYTEFDFWHTGAVTTRLPNGLQVNHRYSRDWAQCGQIIDRIKGFELKQWLSSSPESCCEAHIHNYDGDWIQFGSTLLIAAMRCYVASKLGDEVEIPDELVENLK